MRGSVTSSESLLEQRLEESVELARKSVRKVFEAGLWGELIRMDWKEVKLARELPGGSGVWDMGSKREGSLGMTPKGPTLLTERTDEQVRGWEETRLKRSARLDSRSHFNFIWIL